ncbi:MAG: (d)CMP kinase [Gemmatimonadales bacterium]
MRSRVVAIDGPAGSGKSTTARAVARELGLAHLDSGALYRAVTLAALDAGIDLSGQKIVALVRSLPVRLDLTAQGFRPGIAGVDVSAEVRTQRVTTRVSQVSALPEVRDWVNQTLRQAAALHPVGVVVDGRDIGTVVFPDADVKIFLSANREERARRRLLQQGQEVDAANIARVAAEQDLRDTADSSRAVAPLAEAADAIRVDTSAMTFDAQVQRVVSEARKAFS